MAKKQSLVERVRSRFSAPVLSSSVDDIAGFYKTPVGKAMLSGQKRVVGDALGNLFGYHLMELSPLEDSSFSKRSRVNHCFSVRPFVTKQTVNSMDDAATISSKKALDSSSVAEPRTKVTSVMASDPIELPLADESIDVCILHHVLEFSEQPHQILKEAARVTIARGHIVIIGFNPTSLLGLIKPLCQPFRKNTLWRRRSLRVSRLHDWLEFLDFSYEETAYAAHNLPINNEKYLRSTRGMEKFFRRKQWPFGSIYCIVACKDKMSVTPIKPAWSNTSLAGLAKKRAIRSGLGKSASRPYSREPQQTSGILPFRRNLNKNR